MATSKMSKNNPRCKEHEIPIVITIPEDRIGNSYGEEWYCPKCKGSPGTIIVS